MELREGREWECHRIMVGAEMVKGGWSIAEEMSLQEWTTVIQALKSSDHFVFSDLSTNSD